MRIILACLVIFIIGYNLGNKQFSDNESIGIFPDTITLEEFNEDNSSLQVSTIAKDSSLNLQSIESNFLK